MKSESGLSLLEIIFCLTLITITLLGITTAKNQAMLSVGKMQTMEKAMELAEKQLRYWQYCGASDLTSAIDTCHSFDNITDFSQDIPPYSMTAIVTPVSFSSDGSIVLKKVKIEVSWENSGNSQEVQKIEVTSAFSRHNIFNSLH